MHKVFLNSGSVSHLFCGDENEYCIYGEARQALVEFIMHSAPNVIPAGLSHAIQNMYN